MHNWLNLRDRDVEAIPCFGSKNQKLKYINKDPKDGELYLERIKSGETLMEVRSDTNVQIVRRIWV